MAEPEKRLCGIPARTLPPCDLEWGHDGDMHGNRGDGFYAAQHLAEHRRRQAERNDRDSKKGSGTMDEAVESVAASSESKQSPSATEQTAGVGDPPHAPTKGGYPIGGGVHIVAQRVVNNGVIDGNGSGAVVKKSPPSVISNQLREELIRILRTGDDKNEGAFTVAVAAHVEKFAVAAREILMTENLAQGDLASLMMMRRQHMGSSWVGLGSDSLMPMPLVNNENFGVQAVRQIVDAVQTMGETPAKLVEALAVARSNNLPDVVAVLEKKLGVAKAAEGEAPEGAPP